MARPLVVGANGVVGFREQVIPSGPDQSGLHVNGNDPADIAWGIQSILEDPARGREMGARGRTRVQRYFTWEQVARQTVEVYQAVIEQGRRKVETA